MLQEFLYIFQVALILLFYQAYSKRDEILWAMSAVFSGALVFLFYTFGTNEAAIIAVFNVGIFLLSIIWFFIDLFSNRAAELFRTLKVRVKKLPDKILKIKKEDDV
jgi:hypothetical protein